MPNITPHPNLLNPDYTQDPVKLPDPPTDYRLDPETNDPANITAWRTKRHPRGLTLTNRKPIWAFLFMILLFALFGAAPPTIHALGIIDVGVFRYIFPAFSALLIALAIAALIVARRRSTPTNILDHDTMADTLTLHSQSIDPDDVLAVERITFNYGFKPHEDLQLPRDQRRGSYTSKTHLVLKTKLPPKTTTNSPDTHPSSNQPGTRYHLIASTHIGLRNTGKPIATSLNVPYTHSSLGTFTKVVRTPEEAFKAEMAFNTGVDTAKAPPPT